MNACNRPGTRLIAAIALALAGTAQASTVLLSENFNGVKPGTFFPSWAVGPNFSVIAGTIDILGDLGGSFFLCPNGAGNNCVDLNGGGPGSIRTASSFDLLAGYTYEVSFDLAPGPEASYKARVTLGSHSEDFTAVKGTGFVHMSMLFTPVSGEAGARLTFHSLGATTLVPLYWGAQLDNVVLTATAPVPESETYAMFLAGLGLLGAAARRRKAIAG